MFRMIAHFLCSRSADKPGSVVGGHLSGTAVARRLMRPTRGSDGTGHPVQGQPQGLPLRRPCLALLPVGVAWPPGSPRTPVVSYTTFSPLPGRERGRAVSGILVDRWPVYGRVGRMRTPHPPPIHRFARLPPPNPAVCFCGPIRRVTPPGRYPAPCPVEPGLSSPRAWRGARPPGRPGATSS
jgi:hypothetical protein